MKAQKTQSIQPEQGSHSMDDLWRQLERRMTHMEHRAGEVERLRELVDAQHAQFASQREEIRALQKRREDHVGLDQPEPVRLRRPGRRTSRRAMLKAALSATVATVGAGMLLEQQTGSALASATETKSASGVGNVAIEGNGSSLAIGLAGTSGGTPDFSTFPAAGVLGYSHDPTTGTGVSGQGTGQAWGVFGTSTNSFGVVGSSTNSYGVVGIGSGNSIVGAFGNVSPPYPAAAVVGDGGSIGRGVYGTSDSDAGLSGRGGFGGTGVFGHTVDGSGIGVHGQCSADGTGVYGESSTGTGVFGIINGGSGIGVWGSGGGYGGYFSGNLAPLWLDPAGTAGAPTSGNHAKGEVYVDVNGVFWVCVIGNGTDAGTWKALSSVVPIPNVRVMNTRPGKQIGPYLGPIANNTVLTLTLAGANGIPSNATGVMGNLTAADATAGCFLALVPHGANHVGVSSVNFPALAQGSGVANSFTVGLSSDGKVDIYTGNCSIYTVNIIIDIVGFIV